MYNTLFQYEMYLQDRSIDELENIQSAMNPQMYPERYRLVNTFLFERKMKENPFANDTVEPLVPTADTPSPATRPLYVRSPDRLNPLVLLGATLAVFCGLVLLGRLGLHLDVTPLPRFTVGNTICLIRDELTQLFPEARLVYTKNELKHLNREEALFAIKNGGHTGEVVVTSLYRPNLSPSRIPAILNRHRSIRVLYSQSKHNELTVSYQGRHHYYLTRYIQAYPYILKMESTFDSSEEALEQLKLMHMVDLFSKGYETAFSTLSSHR